MFVVTAVASAKENMQSCRKTLIPLFMVLRVLTVVALFGLVTGCGGNSTQPPATTIAFESSRALDGSDTLANTGNIWVIKSDGSGATPLTRLTGVAASDADLVWSVDVSKIAFISSRALDGSNAVNANDTFNIWLMNADGSGATPLTRLTTTSGQGTLELAWSPDGRKIAFSSNRALDGSDAVNTNQTSNIWVVNTDGTGAIPLTRYTVNSAGASSPVWSRDGSKIAFNSGGALDGSDTPFTAFNTWVMNADGSSAAPLTRFAAAFSFHPVFSPDGTNLAFLSNRGLDGSDVFTRVSNIWVAKADGSGAIPITKYTAVGAEAAQGFTVWSPDGKKLAFASNAALDGRDAVSTNSTSNVWVANADGSGATSLTKLTYPGVAAGAYPYGWSPDSANLVFASDGALDGSNVRIFSNVWVMKADGSNVMPLTRAGSSSPAWKP